MSEGPLTHGEACAVLQRLYAPNSRVYPGGEPCAFTISDFCSRPRTRDDYMRFAGWWVRKNGKVEERLLDEIERYFLLVDAGAKEEAAK